MLWVSILPICTKGFSNSRLKCRSEHWQDDSRISINTEHQKIDFEKWSFIYVATQQSNISSFPKSTTLLDSFHPWNQLVIPRAGCPKGREKAGRQHLSDLIFCLLFHQGKSRRISDLGSGRIDSWWTNNRYQNLDHPTSTTYEEPYWCASDYICHHRTCDI